jgi:hypothetical protein
MDLEKTVFDKKRVAPTLRQMEIGDFAYFPKSQRESVFGTVNRLHHHGFGFSIKTGKNCVAVEKRKNPTITDL